MIGTILGVLLAAFIIYCIFAYTIGYEWGIVALLLVSAIYHIYKYREAVSSKTPKMSLPQIIIRVVQQIIIVFGVDAFLKEGSFFEDWFNLTAFIIAFVLSIIDYIFYVKSDSFYKTERHTWTSDTKFDVSVDDRKKQIEVKPHEEKVTYFDETRILTFLAGYIVNRTLPILHIFLRLW